MSVLRAHRLRAIAPAILGVLLLAAGTRAAFAQQLAAPAPEWDPWYVLLPIDQPGGAARIAEPRAAEDELPRHLLGKEGPDLSRIYPGKKAVVVSWVPLEDKAWIGSVPEFGAIDFLKLVPEGVPGNDASAYLYCRVRARTAVTAQCRFGYDDAARIWLNGKLVAESTRPGAFEPLADKVELDLVAGDNHLLVKVTNAGGAWRFRMLPAETKPLAGRAAAQLKVNAAIERGCDYLVSMQSRDGSWSFDDERFPGGQTALSIYALLKSGISPKHHAIQRGVAYLKARPALHTYTSGCTLLALWALHDRANDAWMADLTDELLSWQQGGMWAYPDGEADLSNTQYAALGLFAAARSGVKIPPKAWRDLISQVMHFQGRSGGLGYKLGDTTNPKGSMTAAGVSVLAIAKAQLTDGNSKNQGMSLVDDAIEQGTRWLAERFTISGAPLNDPKAALEARWGPYYLYGVERMCALLDLERLGGADWYWEGASWFLDVQGAKGDFPTAYGEGEPNTCFGLLFLGRATASFTGKSAERKDSLHQTDDAKSDVWMRASGDAQVAMWVGGFSKRILTDYVWKDPAAKGLHVAKIEYLVDGEVVETVEGDPTRAWKGDKYSLQHKFEDGGLKRLAVRAHLLIEPATKGAVPVTSVIESGEMEVFVTEIAAPHLLAQAAAEARNLLRASETKVTASSQASDSPATAAIDNRESSAWTCAPEDKTPMFTLELDRPLKVSQVMLSGLGGRPDVLGDFDRATKVELRVNKSEPPIVVMLETDELKTTLIDLGRQVVLRTLEIKILERVTGKKHPGRVGFNEIGLFSQPAAKK